MGHPPSGRSDNLEPREPSPLPPAADTPDGEPEIVTSYADVEPGWKAARALTRLRSDALLAVMLRASFRPVRDLELVQVTPCPYCGDGGLRVAGSVRVRQGRVVVRACDTCAAVDIGERQLPPKRRRRS